MLVIQAEIVDVAGTVVAIHNVPGEGDVGAVLINHLEVADILVLGSCTVTQRKGMVGLHSVWDASQTVPVTVIYNVAKYTC